MIGEISVVPVGGDSASMKRWVDRAIEAIRSVGVQATVTAMGTNVEGTFDDILKAFRAAHDACLEEGVTRVMATLRIDDRVDAAAHLEVPADATEAEGTKTLQ